MAADFPSFDWHDRDLGDEALRQAHAELMEPTDLDVYLRAFSSMRHSGHTAAAAIALDYFQHSGGRMRCRSAAVRPVSVRMSCRWKRHSSASRLSQLPK